MSRPPLFQIAYFVTDLEASIARWHRACGAGPFTITPHHVAEQFEYRGGAVEADVSYAFGYQGDVMVQLIEQHDDRPSIYREMFAAGEEGFHHIGLLVDDFAVERQRFIDDGYEVACELHNYGVDAAYFDTRADIGYFTEIHNHPPRIEATFAAWRDAHRTWRAGDPLFSVRQ